MRARRFRATKADAKYRKNLLYLTLQRSEITFVDSSNSTAGTIATDDATARIRNSAAQLASLFTEGSPEDLPKLAQLHTAFGALSGQASDVTDRHLAAAVEGAAAKGMTLVERIVLKEVEDLQGTMEQVGAMIGELQAYLNGVTPTTMSLAAVTRDGPATAPASGPRPNEADHAVAAEQMPLIEADLPLVREFVAEAAGHVEAAEVALLQLEEDGGNVDAINAVFRAFHTIKGVAGFLNLTQIGALAHAAENVLDLARQGKLNFDPGVADTVLSSADAMKKLIDLVGRVATTGGVPALMPGLDQLLARLQACAKGEAHGAVAPKTVSTVASASMATEVAKPVNATSVQGEKGEANHGAQATPDTIKVSTERLDALINTVGELVIAQAMVQQDMAGHVASGNQRLVRNMSHLGKITRELQELSMSMRMVPIAGVFQKMSRLVRDVSRKAGKEINLVLTGKETELDRNVVEAIGDPLVHMVRNAADHGVESPDVRETNGKPRVGTIELKAYHQSGSVVIEIIDDGKGLDKARILKKAIAAGIVREDEELSEADIFKLIFHAGLSTAEKVTDISGRGVGMDVVKRNIEGLRGRIDIASTPGRGSTFTIRLPLTLAVIDGLVVKVGAERYILPITSIEQSLRPKPEQMSTVQGRGEICLIRGRTLPLYRLHKMFNVTPKFEDPTQSLVVIVQDDDRRCCLLVDELLGQEQVVIKSLGEGLGQVPGTSGGAILGDGNVSLILDVPGLMKMAEQQ